MKYKAKVRLINRRMAPWLPLLPVPTYYRSRPQLSDALISPDSTPSDNLSDVHALLLQSQMLLSRWEVGEILFLKPIFFGFYVFMILYLLLVNTF